MMLLTERSSPVYLDVLIAERGEQPAVYGRKVGGCRLTPAIKAQRVNHVMMADFAFDNVVHLSPF